MTALAKWIYQPAPITETWLYKLLSRIGRVEVFEKELPAEHDTSRCTVRVWSHQINGVYAGVYTGEGHTVEQALLDLATHMSKTKIVEFRQVLCEALLDEADSQMVDIAKLKSGDEG